jgi:CPA2 family monovalent cation:H+ antiporter-2
MIGEEFVLFSSLSAMMAVAFLVHLGALRFKRPQIQGLILAGMILRICGDHFFPAVKKPLELFDGICEFGASVTLFYLGVSFSLERMKEMRREIFLGGSLQVLCTTLLGALSFYLFLRHDLRAAIFVGLLMSTSSMVLVVERLESRNKVETAGGQFAIGTVLFQCIALLPMGLMAPVLSPNTADMPELLTKLGAGILGSIFVFWLELKLVRPFFDWVLGVQDSTLFTFAVVFTCVITMMLACLCGLPYGFGMFIAGVLISGSNHRFEAARVFNGLKDISAPLHFLALGLLIDVDLIAAHWFTIGLSIIGCIVVKILAGLLSPLFFGLQLRSAFKVSGSLANQGEMSFLLAAAGAQLLVFSDVDFRVYVVISVCSIFLSPSIMDWSLRIGDRLPAFTIATYHSALRRLPSTANLDGATVAIGCGSFGKPIADHFHSRGEKVVVIEDDFLRLKEMREFPYASVLPFNALTRGILDRAGVARARRIFIGSNSVEETKAILSAVRRLNKDVRVVIRLFQDGEETMFAQDLNVTPILIPKAAVERVLQLVDGWDHGETGLVIEIARPDAAAQASANGAAKKLPATSGSAAD